mgnify:CR=1 FL=1|nr:Rrf2 family transcriptional regulator [uncultured Blautia sp.]
MDTRFSVAVHALILIAKSDISLTSEQIAASVGVNPSYVRKVLASLRNAGIISAHRGVRGFKMNSDVDTLSLFQIYTASCEGNLSLFDIHQNPNDQCIVGRHIKPVLGGMFRDLENELSQKMQKKTLGDCIDEILKREQKSI